MDLGPLHRRAALQGALVTHAQLVALGYSQRQIRTLRSSGVLIDVHRGVYRLVGTTPTWELRARAATLTSIDEHHLSHRSALAWWPGHDFRTPVIEILTESQVRSRHVGVRSHQTIDLPAADRRRHAGVAVTSIERSLLDAGRYLPPALIGEILDHSVRAGLTTYERFERRVHELARRGRDGVGTARLVLADRGYGDGFGFEKALRGLLRDAGLPEPVREFPVHVGGHRYRVDFAYPASMVGIECDSSAWHELPYQRDLDARRQNRIQNEGLLLLRYTVARLRSDPGGIRDEIADALRRRAGLQPDNPLVFPTLAVAQRPQAS